MAHIKQIEIGQESYLIEPTLYVATTLTGDTYSAMLTNFTPDIGVSIQIKITDTNPASAKLKINNDDGTGVPLYYDNAPISSGLLQANHIYSVVYTSDNNNNYWSIIGELNTDHYDWNDITNKPTTLSGYGISDGAIASHVHGNILTDGTITGDNDSIVNNDKLLIARATDGLISVRNGLAFDGSSGTYVLSKKGTWEQFPIQSVANVSPASGSTDIDGNALRQALNLSNAMHFIGIVSDSSTYQPENNTKPDPTNEIEPTSLLLEGNITYNSPNDGDVILDSDCVREYVWAGGANGTWKLLGSAPSSPYVITPPQNDIATMNIPTWVYSITQDTTGTISATYKTMGVLPVANGGTGLSEWNSNGIVYYDGTNNTEFAQIVGSNTNAHQPLISNGAGAPGWYAGLLLQTNTVQNQSPTYSAIFSGSISAVGNIIPQPTITTNENTNESITTYPSLGTSSARWSAVHIGEVDKYGDAYTPIYWNNGVPTTITTVQYVEFTIDIGQTGVQLTHTAFTTDSYVLQIVVNDGESNLNGPIEWDSDTAGSIKLKCATTSGAVSGYILVARGGALTPVTSTQLPIPSVDPSEPNT